MRQRSFRVIATGLALTITLALAGCSSSGAQSGTASESGSESGTSSSTSAIPEVDRSGNGDFPEVTQGADGIPTVAAGTGEEPSVILAKTLTTGDGPEVGLDDVILANYHGTLWDGTVFDSSFTRGAPLAFGLNQVIQGWKYGLATQHVGDRVELVIPSTWGYGPGGAGSSIPGDATLTFVVDIVDTVNPDDTTTLSQAMPTDAALPEGISIEGVLGTEPTLSFTAGVAPVQDIIVLAEGQGPEITEVDHPVYQTVAGYFGDNASVNSTWGQSPLIASPGASELVGKKVGSRVLFIFDAAPAAQSGATSASTIMVVDLVGALNPNR